jgi:hypothetical protein
LLQSEREEGVLKLEPSGKLYLPRKLLFWPAASIMKDKNGR